MRNRSTVSFALLVAAAPGAAATAQGPAAPIQRQFTVSAGVGNEFGLLGGQAEWHFRGDRVSVFAGAGRLSRPTVAAGLRGYAGGGGIRPFAEVALVPLKGIDGPAGHRTNYGPSGRLGVQLIRPSGLGVTAGVGLGYQLGDRPFGRRTVPTAGIGIGFTFRR